jgi:predicted DCC family thiol-disulfide oxidoreductase YuxK
LKTAVSKSYTRRAGLLYPDCNIEEMPDPILLYDGVCGLCNRLVQFILRRDRAGIFRFASLQSPSAARLLAGHGANAEELDTFFVVVNPDEQGEFLLSRSDAVLYVLQQLGGFWRMSAQILRVLPRPVREWIYRTIARNRYRIFGRYETCPVPDEKTRSRFLDQ